MVGRLHVDLNGADVKLRFVRSKNAFLLMAGGQNPDYKVQIVEAILFARNAVLNPTVQMAHIKALAKGTDKWTAMSTPYHKVPCPTRTRISSSERYQKRLILWCIDNDAYNGNYAKKTFNANNNAINVLATPAKLRERELHS